MGRNNKGYEVEFGMKKWFNGKTHKSDCVDFQTKTSLCEVKSCNLFNQWGNSNHKRKRKRNKTLSKQVFTTHMGRFYITNSNHYMLNSVAKKEEKIPKYIFVMCVGKQKIWCVKSWDFVEKFIDIKKNQTTIRLKDIFGDKCL